MHALFYHKYFLAQFGHVAGHLARSHGWRCTFVTERGPGRAGPVELVGYRPAGGATARARFFSRTFENAVAHAHGLNDALKARPDVRTDVMFVVAGEDRVC